MILVISQADVLHRLELEITKLHKEIDYQRSNGFDDENTYIQELEAKLTRNYTWYYIVKNTKYTGVMQC